VDIRLPKIISNAEKNMVNTFKKYFKNFKNNSGNSLMEFAVTIALMAILAATAAPKLSKISEGAKIRKSLAELDKIGRNALNFYQDTATKEGRGRFPGQEKYNIKLGGHTTEQDIIDDLFGAEEVTDGSGNITTPAVEPTFKQFSDSDGTSWISIFGSSNADKASPVGASLHANNEKAISEWKTLFADQVLSSKFQDGHFVFQVVAGSGSGSKAVSPTLYVADIENPSQLNYVIKP